MDDVDVRILECISKHTYTRRSELWFWVKEIVSPAILQHRLDLLEELGFIERIPDMGYRRTKKGDEIIKNWKRRK